MSKINEPIMALGPQKKNESISISELYHENTRLHPLTAYLTAPPTEFAIEEMQAMARGFKQYPMVKKVPLPAIKDSQSNLKTFDEVIASRRSLRNFSNKKMALEELSKILFQSYGITGEMPLSGGEVQPLRASPSAGALYPGEIYIAVQRVTGLEPGIYHYNVPNHELEILEEGDPTEKVSEVCCGQIFAKEASVVVLISAVLERTKSKYGERGYRYALLDLGHLGQNIYLSCTSLKLAVMTTCGFFDDLGNELLKLDGLDETLMYVAFIGEQKK